MKWLKLTIAVLILTLAWGTAWAADLASHQLLRALACSADRFVTTDGSIAMRIQWLGAAGAGATIDVDADGNILFTTDGTTADATVSTDGTVTVAGATENTFGEVCDVINVSANWACILVDVLPSWSCDNVLTDVAESAAGAVESPVGVALAYNTADLDRGSVALGPEWAVDDFWPPYRDRLFNHRSTPADAGARTYTHELYYLTAKATFSGATSQVSVYAVDSDHAGATETLLWQEVGAATTVAKALDFTGYYDPDDGRVACIRAPKGQRMVVVYQDIDGSPVMTACTIQAHGLSIANK